MADMSLSAFARKVGCSVQAVSKGAKAGRLRASLGKDAAGRPVVVDFDLAALEWRENRGKLPPAPKLPEPNLDPTRETVPRERLSVIRDGERIYLAWLRSGDGSVNGAYDDSSDPIFPISLDTAAELVLAIVELLKKPDGYSTFREWPVRT
jgi:hypothetical protein